MELDGEAVFSPRGVVEEELEDFLSLGRGAFGESVVEGAGEFQDREAGGEVRGVGALESLEFFLDGASAFLELLRLLLEDFVVEVQVEEA